MKCSKFYKIIPSGEEIWKREESYFHEECLIETNQQDGETVFRLGIGLALLVFGLALVYLFNAFKSRKKLTKKSCYYCEKFCNNACQEVKWNRKMDLELAKFLFLSGLAILTTFTVYWITNSGWSFWIFPILFWIIHLQTKNIKEAEETI